jgi:hypothetical protein
LIISDSLFVFAGSALDYGCHIPGRRRHFGGQFEQQQLAKPTDCVLGAASTHRNYRFVNGWNVDSLKCLTKFV